jgi:hypothetical protein
MHIHRVPGEEPNCICGALLGESETTLCRKCSARSRWHHRRSGARRHVWPGRIRRADPWA